MKQIILMGIAAVGVAFFSSCGVKKSPDLYYHHPMQFDDAPYPVTPSPSPRGVPDDRQ